MDVGYVSGTALSGSMFFTGVAFADRASDVGDTVFSLSNRDTFTVRVAAQRNRTIGSGRQTPGGQPGVFASP